MWKGVGAVISASVFIAVPASAGGVLVQQFDGNDKAWATAKVVGVVDRECDKHPVSVRYVITDNDGNLDGPYSFIDKNGCKDNADARSYKGTGWSIHKISIGERRKDGNWWYHPWVDVVTAARVAH